MDAGLEARLEMMWASHWSMKDRYGKLAASAQLLLATAEVRLEGSGELLRQRPDVRAHGAVPETLPMFAPHRVGHGRKRAAALYH
jgi:hypothetical protein